MKTKRELIERKDGVSQHYHTKSHTATSNTNVFQDMYGYKLVVGDFVVSADKITPRHMGNFPGKIVGFNRAGDAEVKSIVHNMVWEFQPDTLEKVFKLYDADWDAIKEIVDHSSNEHMAAILQIYHKQMWAAEPILSHYNPEVRFDLTAQAKRQNNPMK
jgi:hypothetical protein